MSRTPPARSPTPTCPAASRRAERATSSTGSSARSTPCSTASSAASSAQRRFIDDAGHELRTPITIVRGHLEVLDPADPADVRDDRRPRRRRAGPDEPDGVGPAAARPRRAAGVPAARSRSTSPRSPRTSSRRSPQLGDRDWALETAARVDAVLDPQRITQALVALADNACRYTAARRPDRRGHLSSRAAGCGSGSSDTGPGVSRGRPRPDLRALRPRQRGRAAAPTAPGSGWRSCAPSPSRTAGDVLLDSMPGSRRHLHRRHSGRPGRST